MPQQVKDDAARVDAIIQRNAAAAQGELAADDDSAAPEPVVVEAEAQPQGAEVLTLEQPGQDDTPDGTDAEPATAAQIQEALDRAERAEQRWKSLDGQLRSKDEQIERLTDLVGKMHEAPPATPAPEDTLPVGTQAGDADAFGDDMIDFVQRIARQVARSELESVAGTLEGLKRDVTNVSQHTAVAVHDSFEAKLDKLAPSWRQFDRDEGFHGWLSASQTKQQMFLNGANQKDAELVAEFFNMYASTLEPPKAEGKKSAKSELEKQVAPGKSRSTQTPSAAVTTDERIWTRSEIAQAYSDNSKGKYTPEEWGPLEREIAAAQANERVDYSK